MALPETSATSQPPASSSPSVSTRWRCATRSIACSRACTSGIDMEIFRSALLIGKSRMPAFKRIPYQPAPSFLGEFSLRRYSPHHRLPDFFVGLVARLAKFAPEQDFNTVFIQRYREGE